MLMVDATILIHAHRRDAPAHEWYRDWWNGLANAGDTFALSSLVAVAFVRSVTQPNYANGPTGSVAAIDVIDTVAAHPRCRLLEPGPRHWSLVSRLCRLTGATGKQVADAQHAAVAIEHGCTWVSRDPGFGRFVSGGLQWKPLLPGPA